MTLIYNKNEASIYVGDCVDFTSSLPASSIDLTVTSPPYDDLRTYTSDGEWNFDMFKKLATELYRVTREGGVVVWNVCDQTANGSESGNSFRQALHFMEVGFNLADTMIYKKANPGGARGSNKTYLQCFEYMFIFSKGKLRTYNLINDRPNKRPGAQKGGGRRNRDGTSGETVLYDSAEFGRRFNIWEYPTQPDQWSARHPAPFPLRLAVDHILSWSNENDVVFDPFLGSGTTAVASLQNNRKFIGVDVSRDYADLAVSRLEEYTSPFSMVEENVSENIAHPSIK